MLYDLIYALYDLIRVVNHSSEDRVTFGIVGVHEKPRQWSQGDHQKHTRDIEKQGTEKVRQGDIIDSRPRCLRRTPQFTCRCNLTVTV